MLSRVFFLALTLTSITAPVMSNCPSPQFCSKCPRKDNAGHSLQVEIPDDHYVHCQYQDTDCFYGPLSQVFRAALSSWITTKVLAFSLLCRYEGYQFSDGISSNSCPPALMANICSVPIVPQPQLLDTVCPFSNNNAINMPLHSQPTNPSYIQCHYSTSECYYDVCFIHSDDCAYL